MSGVLAFRDALRTSPVTRRGGDVPRPSLVGAYDCNGRWIAPSSRVGQRDQITPKLSVNVLAFASYV